MSFLLTYVSLSIFPPIYRILYHLLLYPKFRRTSSDYCIHNVINSITLAFNSRTPCNDYLSWNCFGHFIQPPFLPYMHSASTHYVLTMCQALWVTKNVVPSVRELTAGGEKRGWHPREGMVARAVECCRACPEPGVRGKN